ncbi:MAG: hypothetical protein NC078_00190 [Ruminococcus sp.]|nr:hypothetical protein [Ruminococcus sp.]
MSIAMPSANMGSVYVIPYQWEDVGNGLRKLTSGLTKEQIESAVSLKVTYEEALKAREAEDIAAQSESYPRIDVADISCSVTAPQYSKS